MLSYSKNVPFRCLRSFIPLRPAEPVYNDYRLIYFFMKEIFGNKHNNQSFLQGKNALDFRKQGYVLISLGRRVLLFYRKTGKLKEICIEQKMIRETRMAGSVTADKVKGEKKGMKKT